MGTVLLRSFSAFPTFDRIMGVISATLLLSSYMAGMHFKLSLTVKDQAVGQGP